ncbi:related to morphogenesis-related protein MSB1 [Cephalotrichum gorgonifer]|uniref:Related to morphogenesis-related protein MSB1 n=1 Tax=Cephalotrichum gorgonifer TaxID=2041049 RepID=A0AAE8MZI8_9PEZI|nr:related to morphogenesis-related protein MSB1 [Cephalotrichum gorgonifer]
MAGFFSRFRSRDGKKSKKGESTDAGEAAPQRWADASARTSVEPEEIQELIRRCTEELKSRALRHPFLLLPFRPASDPSAVRTFIRHFFDPSQSIRGETLAQELRMTEVMVISGIVKWCWSRLSGGVVGWDAYELFKVGEQDSNMARDSFKTFIPLSVDNGARSCIIFDFFDLLSAIAAHGKTNGFGGRKLSRMAAWWAFEHKDSGSGFDGGYKTWINAADATSHLFFAYLRSLSPQGQVTGITMLPMSLQKLLQETEYPPQRPSLMQSTTNKVLMHVDTVSPTPFALLRRGNHFQYRDDDRGLSEYSEYDDPVQALTEECRRVLRAISSSNQSQVSSSKHSTSLRDASWSRFEDIGFTTTLEEDDEDDESGFPRKPAMSLRSTPATGNGLARPTTPSWADFMSSGFVDENGGRQTNTLLPPEKALPRIETTVRQRSSQSHRPRLESDRTVEPGELASITHVELDDAFWWVWMCSLAPEETAERKSAFGRCAVVETNIKLAKWLIMEEMVVGSGPEPDAGAYIAEKKKGFFSWTRRGKGLNRRKSTAGKQTLDKGFNQNHPLGLSKTSIGPDQHARIQAAAAQLQAKQNHEEDRLQAERRGRSDEDHLKTTSIMTLQPAIVNEASHAMKWASKYDKEAIKTAYLADSSAGRGIERSPSRANGHTATNGARPATPDQEPQITEKGLEAPQGVHPAERAEASSPIPPAKNDVDDAAVAPVENKASLEAGSPDSKKHKKLQKEKAPVAAPPPTPPSSGGLRKLFGRKNRASKVPDNAAAELNGMLQQERDVTTPTASAPSAPVAAAAPTPAPAPAPAAAPAPAPVSPSPIRIEEARTPTKPAPAPFTEPTYTEPTYNPSMHSNSEPDADDVADANKEFARFDQGPLTEQPAFVGDDSDTDDALPPPISRRAREVGEPLIPVPKRSSDRLSEAQQPQSIPALDRWAQIRKNAAERAAQQEALEKQREALPKQDTVSKHDGDDETSGEETIESRVARIKARVAELTGNMEDTSGPGARNGVPRY